MTDQGRLALLRQQAKAALAEYEHQPDLNLQTPSQHVRLVEELQIYQTELELQNQQLQQVQNQLVLQRDHYQGLFENLPVGCLLLGEHGKIIDLNAPALQLFSFKTAQQALNYNVFRLFDDASIAWLLETLKQAPSTSRQARLQLISMQKRRLAVDATFISLPTQNSLKGAALLVLQDASIESKLEQERLLFGAVMEHSPAMIFVLDPQLRVQLANKEFILFHKLDTKRVIGTSALEFFSEDSIKRLNGYFDALYLRGVPQTYEYEYLSPQDNKLYYLQTTAFAIRDPRGHITSAGFITTDITAKMDAETRLQTAMQIFSEGSEGIIIADPQTRILSVNRAFEQITGYAQHEVIGKKPSILSSGKHDSPFYREMWHIINTQGHWEGEIWNKRKSGELYPQWLNISRLPKLGPVVKNYIAVFSDITERLQNQKFIESLAYYDSLTGMANRNLLRDRVEQLIKSSERSTQTFVLLFIDLDKFKDINDIHGHDTGDRLLVELSQRMRSLFRDSDTLCRLGGDEFVVVLPDANANSAMPKVQQLIELIASPIQLADLMLKVTASIGLVEYPRDGSDYQELLKHADFAMYRAKSDGKNRVSSFDHAMIEHLHRRLAITNALEHALQRQEFHLVFQPILCVERGTVGVEALLRWTSTDFGIVSPDEFIPLAEESGMIQDIGLWVLQQSLQQLASWQQQFAQPLYVSVNVSAQQFWSESFPEKVFQAVQQAGTHCASLQLEVTERVAMQEPAVASRVMKQLKGLGVSIALDDFGTGYSSLAYLKHLPIDVLKVDKSFVRDIGIDADDEEICRTIINLSKSLGLTTTAEGVEEEHQLQFLTDNGCTHVQGYLFAKPLPAASFSTWLSNSERQRFESTALHSEPTEPN